MRKLFLTLILLVLPVWSAIAGGVTSGGGYVVVCYTDDTHTEIKDIKLLDFFEAVHTVKKFKLKELPAGSDYYEIAKSVIDRLNTFSPDLVREWKATIDAFKLDDMNLINRASIYDINDAKTSISPDKNCFKVQAAVQFVDPAPAQYRLIVDNGLWEKMDTLTKVGLLVHEAIYKTALEQGHQESKHVRLLNSYLFSTLMDSSSPLDFLLLFQHANINSCFDYTYTFSEGDNYEAHKLKLSMEIKSYRLHEEHEDQLNFGSGVTCQRAWDMNFLGSGKLKVPKKAKITRDFRGSFCIQNADKAEVTSFQGLDYTLRLAEASRVSYDTDLEGNHTFQDLVCFHDSTYYHPLVYAQTSTLEPELKFSSAKNITKCTNQTIHNGLITHCGNVEGTVTLENQIFRLKTYRLLLESYEESEIIAEDDKLHLFGTEIKIHPIMRIREDSMIELRNNKNEQWLQINGQRCRLQALDKIVFKSNGDFNSIVFKGSNDFRGNPVAPEDACSKLFL